MLCDVVDMDLVDVLFLELEVKWGKLDFIVYVIGFLDKNELCGCYVDISKDNFMMMMDILVYLFMVVVNCVEKMMIDGGLCLILIYYGVE